MSGRLFHYNGDDRHPESGVVEEEEEEEEEEEGGRESRLPGMNVNWRRYSLPSDRLHSCGSSERSSANSDKRDAIDSDQRRRNSTQVVSGHSHSAKPPSVWQSFRKAGMEFNQDTRKMVRYFGRKLHSRHGPRQTKVKEIHIAPEGEGGNSWATRLAGSGTSRSSSSSDPST